jgi:hypothetical protein
MTVWPLVGGQVLGADLEVVVVVSRTAGREALEPLSEILE